MAISLLATANGDFDITTAGGTAVYNAAPGNAAACLAKADILLGDGTKNLDGTGGDFTLYITVDSQVVQPSPQTFTFSTDVRGKVQTTEFIIPASATVAIKVHSPNAADSDVDVTTNIYQLDGSVVASSVTGNVGGSVASVAANVNAVLVNGAHGGSSATLTLSSATISNAAGDALTITGAGGSAIVLTSDDTGGTIDINSTAASGYAVDINGGTAGAIKFTSASTGNTIQIANTAGQSAIYVSMTGATTNTAAVSIIGYGTGSNGTALSIVGNSYGAVIESVTANGLLIATYDNSAEVAIAVTTVDHLTGLPTGDEGTILGNLSTVTDVTEYPITITPVTSTVSAGEVSETQCTAYTYADFSFVFTVVDSNGTAIDLSGKTVDFIVNYPDNSNKFILSTGTEGGVAISGGSNNIVTVTGDQDDTAYEGSYRYCLRNQTDDQVLARGTLCIIDEPERST